MQTPLAAAPAYPPSAPQHWSTSSVDSGRRLAYWIDTICTSFLEIEIDSPTRNDFRAALDQTGFGPATMSLIAADRQVVRRTPERIARSRYSAFFLLQLREGEAHFSQFGRQAPLHVGDCVLIDCQAPYQLDCLSATKSLALRFPLDWLKNWVPAPEDLAARVFTPTAGWSAALSSAMATLDVDDKDSLALPESLVAEHIAALLALAAGPQASASRPGDKLFNRVMRSLREHAHETDLTPTRIADIHSISTRYLHHLFGKAGTTFGAQLMHERLEAACRMLTDKRFDGLQVGEVAAQCGFVAPSHFARRFRQAFGCVPTDFRARRGR